MQKRYAFFYLIGTLCNGLSGVLAYGIQQMVSTTSKFTLPHRHSPENQAGTAGYNGWRWIFILEGILTVCIGLFGYVFVVNFPEQVAKKPAWGFLKPPHGWKEGHPEDRDH